MTTETLPLSSWLTTLLPVVEAAGAAIMRHYAGDVAVIRKEDGSPTTAADAEAEAIIIAALQKLTPLLPIVAEEDMAENAPPLIENNTFWLVDPLDGTKEFLRKTDEFTVNIGLIAGGIPVLGIIFAPALGHMYYGYENTVVWRDKQGVCKTFSASAPRVPPAAWRVVASKSHLDAAALEKLLGTIPVDKVVQAGSSLKFCLVATEQAEFYPRTGATMEWDTAAGDAIIRAAGGRVIHPDGTPLMYQKPKFLNGSFLVLGKGIVLP